MANSRYGVSTASASSSARSRATAVPETDPVSLGAEISVELEIGNVGDEPTTDVTAAVESGSLSRAKSTTFDELEPGDPEQVTFTFEADEAGALDFEASVESEPAGRAEDSTEVTSETKEGFVQEVVELLAELRERTTDTIAHGGTARSITSKLDAASESLDRALAEIDDGRAKQANNAITTAMNQLGAVLNAIEDQRGRGDRVPERFQVVLERHVEAAIGSLADARDARSAT